MTTRLKPFRGQTGLFLAAWLAISALANCSQEYELGARNVTPLDPTGDVTDDDDTDGVPDPNDDGTTDVTYPFRGNYATVAFEDLFPHPGDADYNDFVMNFRISEHYDDKKQLEKIVLDFEPRHLGASYDHALMVVLDGAKDKPSNIDFESPAPFEGDADVTLKEYGKSGNLKSSSTHDRADDITIIPSTKASLSSKYKLEIAIKHPELNQVSQVTAVDLRKYRVVLHVKNTNQDIDLVTVNPDVTFSDDFPFGLVVPIDWKWPKEGVHIDKVYDRFKNYRAWLAGDRKGTISQDDIKWFNHIKPGAESKVDSD